MSGPPAVGPELVSPATFWFPDEAEVARLLLRSCDILYHLANEHPPSGANGLNVTLDAQLVSDIRAIARLLRA